MALCNLITAAGLLVFCLTVSASEPPKCGKLLDEYDMADRGIARVLVEGSADNSAPRESNRQMRILNATMNKSITLQLMQAAKCGQLPDAADSAADYLGAATLCQAELLKHSYVTDRAAALCNMTTWVRHAKIPASAVVDRVDRLPDTACQMPPCYAPLTGGK